MSYSYQPPVIELSHLRFEYGGTETLTPKGVSYNHCFPVVMAKQN
jgi:hypothetical protein